MSYRSLILVLALCGCSSEEELTPTEADVVAPVETGLQPLSCTATNQARCMANCMAAYRNSPYASEYRVFCTDACSFGPSPDPCEKPAGGGRTIQIPKYLTD